MAVVSAAAPAADDFTSAFDELAALGEKPVPVDFGAKEAGATGAAPPATVVPEAPAAGATGTAPAEETAIEPLTEEEKAAAAAAPTEPEAKTPEQIAAETKAAEEAAAAAAQQAEDDRLAKIIKAVKGDEPKRPEPAPAPTPALYSDDDVKVLTQMETDFPDVAKAMMIHGRAMVAQVTQHIFAEMSKVLGPKLAAYDEMLDRSHARALHERVPDYDTVRLKVLEWVGKQPAYLQGGYTHVIENGTDDEVTDLIERFRKDTGVVKPAPAAPAKPASELSPAAKKAVAALAPVPAKRSSVAAPVSPEDFEGAFDAAVKELAQA
jgi:hypothetical protein